MIGHGKQSRNVLIPKVSTKTLDGVRVLCGARDAQAELRGGPHSQMRTHTAKEEIEVEESSGNVFDDLGHPKPDEALV